MVQLIPLENNVTPSPQQLGQLYSEEVRDNSQCDTSNLQDGLDEEDVIEISLPSFKGQESPLFN